MKLKHAKKDSGFTLVELLVVIAIIAGLAAISTPIIMRNIARSRATNAIANCKDIYTGMKNYEISKGRLPAPAGSAASALNAFFTSKKILDEKPFYVKGTTLGALTINEGNENGELVDGECVFAYWGNSATAGHNLGTVSANCPVLTVPSATGGEIESALFYTADYGGQGVVLSADGGAKIYELDPTDDDASQGTLLGDNDLPLPATTALGSTTDYATATALPLGAAAAE